MLYDYARFLYTLNMEVHRMYSKKPSTMYECNFKRVMGCSFEITKRYKMTSVYIHIG